MGCGLLEPPAYVCSQAYYLHPSLAAVGGVFPAREDKFGSPARLILRQAFYEEN